MLKGTFTISREQVRDCAHEIIDRFIINEFSNDALKLSGLDLEELHRDLMAWPVFHDALIDFVLEFGKDSLDHGFDEYFFDSKLGRKIEKVFVEKIYPVLNMMDDIYEDAKWDAVVELDDCADAISILKKAGYKVVKTK